MTKQVTQEEFNRLVKKIADLEWDYDRMRLSGQQVYDEIRTILLKIQQRGLPT